jgi:hypothetical protein
MALISNAKGRSENDTPSGYERLFGNKELGILVSRVQSAVISMGNELESILADKLVNKDGIAICKVNKENRIFKKAKNGKDVQVDCVIEKDNKYLLIEIKDGDTFDTKKVAGEVESLEAAKQCLINEKSIIPEKITLYYCSFNAASHEQIIKGTKNLLNDIKPLTGKELCAILGLNYKKIVKEREKDQKDNLDYFVDQLAKIPEIHQMFLDNSQEA